MNYNEEKGEVVINFIPQHRFAQIIVGFKRHVDMLEDSEKKRKALKWAAEIDSWIKSLSNGDYKHLYEKKLTELIEYATKYGAGSVIAALDEYSIVHPVYNYFKTFEENALSPWDNIPKEPFQISTKKYNLLGFEIGFPIGVPASVITPTPDWLEYFSMKGFNVLTFKTVRSKMWLPHPIPNWVFLKDINSPLELNRLPEYVVGDEHNFPKHPKQFSMANSFGVPSFAPEQWQKDVANTLKRLQKNQILIVSVMGCWEEYIGQALIDDFVKVSKLAEETGANIIELNLSCPNTVDPTSGKNKGMICEDPRITKDIVNAVRKNLNKKTKLVIKLSYLSKKKLKDILTNISSSDNSSNLIDGVAGINTLQLPLVNESNESVFLGTSKGAEIDSSKNREKAGISGIAIRNYGKDFVKSLSELKKEFNWKFDIIGMGGVMEAKDVIEYLELGASAVQSATAACYNPNLPLEVSKLVTSSPKSEVSEKLFSAIMEIVEQSPKTSIEIFNEIEKRNLISKDFSEVEKILEIALIYNKGIELFGSKEKFNIWLDTKNKALGNVIPKELLNDSFGISFIKDELGRIEYGILA